MRYYGLNYGIEANETIVASHCLTQKVMLLQTETKLIRINTELSDLEHKYDRRQVYHLPPELQDRQEIVVAEDPDRDAIMLVTVEDGPKTRVYSLVPEAPLVVLENLKSSIQSLQVCAVDVKNKTLCRSVALTSMPKPLYETAYKEGGVEAMHHVFGTSDGSVWRFRLDESIDKEAYKPYTDILATESYTAYLQYSLKEVAHLITVVRKGKSTL